ncbi:GNAT family N-acetyltransferase [Flavobacterium sp. Arc3]|uniref:GNAT family N-acetyltransferase n=1 Tax=Flavobacterium sp. Arc3 TaxID=3046686 RepID=UPI00352BF64F
MHNKNRIAVSKTVTLTPISINDREKLFSLMTKIYLPEYSHLWFDAGNWYMNKIYSSVNLERDLATPNSSYYFVDYLSETIGILKLIENVPLVGFKDQKLAKLDRIYLDPTFHSKGIGKTLIHWTENRVASSGHTILWLEAIDTQEKALAFYEKMDYKICGTFKLEYELIHPTLRGMYRMYKTI